MTTFSFSLATSVVTEEADASPLAHETAHGDRAIDHLLSQFFEKPRIEALLRNLIEMVQTSEDLFWQLLTERYLDAVNGDGPAIGSQLDGLGQIVGEPRAQKTDDQYRAFLRVRILVNNSDGKTETLNEILDLIGLDSIEITERPPAHIIVSVTGATWPIETNRYIRQAKAGGVGLTFIYSTYPLDETFQASHTYATEEYDTDTGAGSVYDSSVGGHSSGVYGS